MAILSVLGKNPSGERLRRIENSPNYRDGSFQNLEPTEMLLKGVGFWKAMREYMNKPADTVPPRRLPSVRTDLRSLPSDLVSIVWFGHSSYLLKINGIHILVDPVFSGNASPFSFFGKAFPGADVYKAEDMPDIEILILTHDHYDHLDYKTIKKIAATTRHIYTSLGVGSHLEYWGIDKGMITELDWGETTEINVHPSTLGGLTPGVGTGRSSPGIAGIATGNQAGFQTGTLTATPARHFSGRTFRRNQTLWSSFVLKITGYSIFLGGDSGWGEHFEKIGKEYGPFDLAILESGQYGMNWPYIHMLPEATVDAAIALRAAVLMPVHWGKFVLALHPWDEPVRRVTHAAAEKGLAVTTPLIGEVVTLSAPGEPTISSATGGSVTPGTTGEPVALSATSGSFIPGTTPESASFAKSGKPAPSGTGLPVKAWWESV